MNYLVVFSSKSIISVSFIDWIKKKKHLVMLLILNNN